MAYNLMARYYRLPDGTEPVDAFIGTLNMEVQLAIDRQIDRINSLDDACPHLPYPYSSQIEGEMRELRCHYGNNHYRILYRRSGQFVVLLHIFSKRYGPVPESDKEIARERWADFKKRLDGGTRKPPSPIGGKAPPKKRSS